MVKGWVCIISMSLITWIEAQLYMSVCVCGAQSGQCT